MKKFFLRIGNEMVPVVLGVLIALWINNWQQNRNDRVFLDHVFNGIQKEHDENIIELKLVIPQHERLADSVSFYIENPDIAIGHFPEMTDGMSVAIIGNTSWKSFINNQIRLVDYDIIKLLSGIDDFKEVYQSQTERLTDFFFDNIENTGYTDKETFRTILEDLTGIEEELLEGHVRLKKLFDERK